MDIKDCQRIKESYLAYLCWNISCACEDGICILTLPVDTADRRWAQVTIEHLGNDIYFVRGADVHATKEIAIIYHLRAVNGGFEVTCHLSYLSQTISAVAQASALAMGVELVGTPEGEPVA